MFRKPLCASLAGILACSLISMPAQAASKDFDDISTSAPYYQQVNYCREHGITSGIGNNLFAPNIEITSKQIYTMLLRAYYPNETFDDPLKAAKQKDLTDGASLTEPNMHFLLRNLVGLIFHIADIPVYYENPMDTAIELGLYPETETGDRMATRADCAYLIGCVLQNTYQVQLPEFYQYMNVTIEPGYEEVAVKAMSAIQILPNCILQAWHDKNMKLTFGNTRIEQFIQEENYPTLVTGLYHGDGLSLNSPKSTVHEFGHFVYYESKYPNLQTLVNQYYVKYNDVIAKCVSDYAAKNVMEFFAECFELYFGQGEAGRYLSMMQEQMPEIYQLLDSLNQNNWGFST